MYTNLQQKRIIFGILCAIKSTHLKRKKTRGHLNRYDCNDRVIASERCPQFPSAETQRDFSEDLFFFFFFLSEDFHMNILCIISFQCAHLQALTDHVCKNTLSVTGSFPHKLKTLNNMGVCLKTLAMAHKHSYLLA